MKKILGFHIAKKEEEQNEQKDPTEEIVEEIIEELQEASDPLEEIKQKAKMHKYRFWKTVILSTLGVVFLGIGIYFMLKYQTYGNVKAVTVGENKEGDTSSYAEYAGGIVKYSRDGIVFLNEKGKELWNQPCQMKNPEIEICRGTFAVGDRGGTSLFVFQKDGLKGEVHTTSPIQKFTVSEQGIVGAVLKNELTPQVMCYDAKGNILVEQKASLANTGYPVDLALSNDGKTLLVSYLYTKGDTAASKVVYYNFGKAGEKKKDYRVAETEFEDTIIPTVAFLNRNTSVLVGQNVVVFNRGLENPREIKKIKIDEEIKSIAYDEDGITLILKKSGKTGYQLRTYNANGDEIVAKDFEGEYSNLRMSDEKIIMFDGENCSIFSLGGVHKFEGKMDSKIMEIFPKKGFNKYMVISADELQEVRLIK